MPIASDPNATTEFWLAVDRDKPPATRPVFLIRFMSDREHEQIDALLEQAYALPSTREGNAQCHRLLCEAAAIGIAGWRNMTTHDGQAVEFDRACMGEQLGDLLTGREFWELCRSYPLAVRLSGDDRFLSPSPADSAGEASALAAAASA